MREQRIDVDEQGCRSKCDGGHSIEAKTLAHKSATVRQGWSVEQRAQISETEIQAVAKLGELLTAAPDFQDLLPPLSSEEFAALKADIKANGVRDAVYVDENDVVLDGRNRLKICPSAPRRVVKGLSDGEKAAFVFRSNFNRRNLSPDQKAEVRKKMKATAESLRSENPKKWTQAAIASALGIARETVRDWFETKSRRIGGSANPSKNSPAPKPDARVKLSEAAQEKVFDRVEAGESQEQVAADFAVSQRTVSNAVRKVRNKREKEAEKAAKAKSGKKLAFDGFRSGDYREVATDIPDDSIDLIFTDPPYHREHLDLYGGIAELGNRILREGGSLLCYCGQYLLAEILEAMTPHLRLWWVCAVQHSGQKARMNEYGIVVNWKPVLWFVKKTRGDKRTFIDDLVIGEREKDSHDWQQSIIEANHFIEKLCPPRGTVFDPFCGGGTTVMACKQLKRQFITCDVDENTLNIAKDRYATGD